MSSSQDKKDLHRGALTNFVGYGLKLANPLLLILVANEYGASALGDFLVIQAVLLLLTRFLALGLDKGVLWWVAKDEDQKQIATIFWTLFLFGSLVSGGVFWSAQEYLQWKGGVGHLSEHFRIMLLGLLPALLTDILLHAIMGTKKMGAQVFIKETLVPISMVAMALLLFMLGFDAFGLAWAFSFSHWLGLLVTLVVFLKQFSFRALIPQTISFPNVVLWKYALPLWIAEVSNSFLQRMDIFALTFFVKTGVVPIPGAVGIYGIVVQFANAVRSIRRSFDPIVLAIVSNVGARKDSKRLSEGFSHATFLVTATQFPIFVFFFFFAEWLLGIYGVAFLQGVASIWVLSAFWVINGTLGLCGVVVLGLGYSYFSLINVWIAIAIKALCLWLLIPIWGLEGAAFAVGFAYTIQGLAQLWQMKVVSGGWNYHKKAFLPLWWGAIGVVIAYAIRIFLEDVSLPEVPVWSWWPVGMSRDILGSLIPFLAFVVVYVMGMGRLYLDARKK